MKPVRVTASQQNCLFVEVQKTRRSFPSACYSRLQLRPLNCFDQPSRNGCYAAHPGEKIKNCPLGRKKRACVTRHFYHDLTFLHFVTILNQGFSFESQTF